MNYKKAWSELRCTLLTRGESLFFGIGDTDGRYPQAEAALAAIDNTLKHMYDLEKQITKLKVVKNDNRT